MHLDWPQFLCRVKQCVQTPMLMATYGRARFGEQISYFVDQDGTPVRLPQAPWEQPSAASAPTSADVELLPVAPSKIIGIGRNYRAHAAELGHEVPKEPLYFLKAPSSLLPNGGTVLLPAVSEQVDFEGELGVVIGVPTRNITVKDALSAVFGYVVACDVTARDLQKSDGQWSRAKGFDTFCPLSSRVVTDVDPSALELNTTVNGIVRQDGNTSDMVFSVAELVAHVSAAMTLMPGDLILTGTPSGVGPLYAGDRVEVSIAAVGKLTFDVRQG